LNLALGECLIVLRDKNSVLGVCNKEGKIKIDRISYPQSKA